ncbi:MAG: hypothetical protein ACK41C_03025 [Phenylobacterium sp.]|jgi:hypothetical protein|uniref:hypothetical protein n=1 Tax=Phenylobacterium sp. TaxID=1871053 RepID=UPI00391CF0AD
MKKILLSLAAASALALTAGAASAQAWNTGYDRQAELSARIEAGLRSGDLTRAEARDLRAAMDDLAALEARYRVGGLSSWERTDLDRRYDALAMRIRYDRRDDQRWDDWRDPRGGWMNINQRQARLDQRIEMGLRTGRITPREAASLRAEYRAIANLEARYRANGLSSWERADLDRRFDALAARIRWEARDGERYGYGYGQRW